MKNLVYGVLVVFGFFISGCSGLFHHTYENYDLNITDVNISTHADLILEDGAYPRSITFENLEKEGVDTDNFVFVISLSSNLSINEIAISDSSTYLKSENISIQKLELQAQAYNPDYRIYISSNSLRESKYLENVQDIYFKIDYTIESTVNIPEGFTYTSNKVVIKASDIKRILDDRGIVYE